MGTAARLVINFTTGATVYGGLDAARQINAIARGEQTEYDIGRTIRAGIMGGVTNAMFAQTCFTGDCETLTSRGWVRWDALKVGDRVLSGNEFEPNGKLDYKEVEEIFVAYAPIWHLHIDGGKVIRTTAEHPFYVVGKGWIPCWGLKPSDTLRRNDGEFVCVQEVFDAGYEETVYNCRVADWHTYFVGMQEWGFAVWAHNTYVPTNVSRVNDRANAIRFGHRVAENMRRGTIGKYWNTLGDYAEAVGRFVLRQFGAAIDKVARGAGHVYDNVVAFGKKIALLEMKFSLPLGGRAFQRLVGQIKVGVQDAAATASQMVVWSLREPSRAALRRIHNAVGSDIFNNTQFVHGVSGLWRWARFFFR